MSAIIQQENYIRKNSTEKESKDKFKLRMNHVSLINNYAERGGALFCRGNDVCLFNMTISKNESLGSNTSILVTDPSTLIVNSILWNNLPDKIDSSLINVFYCDIMHIWPGIGNINSDPMFLDSANGDFRLQTGSPCIDAGIQDTMIVYNDGLDTLYIPPIEYSGSTPDIGAYEYVDPLSVERMAPKSPIGYSLSQNYPNPFNPVTAIGYQLSAVSEVTITIYNVVGQEVATLVSERLNAGHHQVEWNAGDYASGIYYYQLVAGEYREVKKMIILK